MSRKLIDLTGERYGRLTVEHLASRAPLPVAWTCRCECGNTKRVRSGDLMSGRTQSCGCQKREGARERMRWLPRTHGMTGTPTHISWTAMKGRCNNPNDPSFIWYGSRGVSVCARWLNSFESFLADMQVRPVGTSLDRIDPRGNYEPSNCKWSTPKEQAAHKRPRSEWKRRAA
jgi:hypothetical protein